MTYGDLTEGYLDGFRASEVDYPERLSNRSELYKHGWLNGRDDRGNKPRDYAFILREEADRLLAEAAQASRR